jgi:TonB family protein
VVLESVNRRTGFTKIAASLWAMLVVFGLPLLAGCAGDKSVENHAPAPAPIFTPIIFTNSPADSNHTNSTIVPPEHTVSRRERPQRLSDPRFRLPPVPSQYDPYDADLIRSIRKRWFELLGNALPSQSGFVTVEFKLYPDGRISDISIAKTTVDAKLTDLCKQAISDAAPFGPWPQSIQQTVQKDFRGITFNFYYDQQSAR